MSRKSRRVATLAAASVVACALLSGASAASATETTIQLKNWAVYGSLTPKKLNEPVVLPKGSTFNGVADVEDILGPLIANIRGNLFVPPFTASLKLVGVVPTTVGVTLTQVGETKGTITTAPASDCPHPRVSGTCVTVAVNSEAIIGLTAAGILGITVPTHCETTEPVLLPLSTHETIMEIPIESHFVGTVTIPSIKCEGLEGIALGLLLTQLMSGPENPYKLGLAPHEPGPPVVETLPGVSVSQISTRLHATAVPNGEPITDCHFEYGTSTKYGTSLPCAEKPVTIFEFEAAEQWALASGLSENTVYHYRIVATNVFGTSYGADQVIQTLSRSTAPQYGQCVLQAHGEYKTSNCLTKSKVAKKGRFEWQPGPAPTCFAKKKGSYTDPGCTVKATVPNKGKFEKQAGPGFTSTGGPLTLEAPELKGTKLECAASSGAGEITGPSTGVERVTFTGCAASGKPCTSEGANSTPSGTPGAITSNLLATRLLGPVTEPNGEALVWTELASSQHEPYVAEFGCGGPLLRIKGSLSGVQVANVGVSSATNATRFRVNEGEQALLTELSENGGSSWAGPNVTKVVTTLSNMTELPTEIKP
jgi:hypothetical protein